MISAVLFLGCTPSGNTGPAVETPDSQQAVSSELIAFVSDREGTDALYVMRPDGSGARRLTENLPPVAHPSWSADGQRIAFNAGSPIASDIHLIKVDGTALTKITKDARANFYPSWSPDGSRIGFATARTGSPELLAVDPETGEEETLFPEAVGGLNPAWSADGSQVAFNVVTSSSGFDIHVASAKGEDRRSIVTGTASEERPRWSPNGDQLTYYSDAGGSWDVYTVMVETGATRSLTDSPGFDGQPSWQPRLR